MSEPKTSKMILAVLQGDDYNSVVNALNQAGFFVTLLQSSGGFLKRRSVTVMIGVDATRLDEALAILKERAGQRKEEIYQSYNLPGSGQLPIYSAVVPCGGVTVFILDIQRIEKY